LPLSLVNQCFASEPDAQVFEFLGLPLRRYRLEDGPELIPFFGEHPQPLSGYTHSMFIAWDPVFHYQWARPEPEALMVTCLVEPDPNLHLLQPVGVLSPAIQRDLLAKIARLPYALKVFGVAERFLKESPIFAGGFSSLEETGASNYIYEAQELALLPGRRFAAKRNHIAQGAREYTSVSSPLVAADEPECLALARALFEESDKGQSFARDLTACQVALQHLDALRLTGTVIRVEGRVTAFAIWEALDRTTAVVHFERALRTHKGLYQVVNQESAKTMLAQGFQLINREEDLNNEGLRKAKLSYYPLRMEKSFTLTFKG
jgi:hypothetical protein